MVYIKNKLYITLDCWFKDMLVLISREQSGNSLSTTFCVWFFKKNTDQILLSKCLYIVRYWAACVLQFSLNQFVTSYILKLTLSFYSSRFSTWLKRQDKYLNILRTKRAFKVTQQKTFFIIFKGLSVSKNCVRPEIAPLTPLIWVWGEIQGA